MKMEPGRAAFPAGGPRPDPDPEPGGPAAPAPRPGLCPPDPSGGADASYPLPGPAARLAPERGPLPRWTPEPEDCVPAGCPGSGLPGEQGCGHGPRAGREVALLASLRSRAAGELALEVGPGAAAGPSDSGQARTVASEPAGCAEDGARLRAVFEALDRDGDGWVRTEDFAQFATAYGAEQVTREPRAGETAAIPSRLGPRLVGLAQPSAPSPEGRAGGQSLPAPAPPRPLARPSRNRGELPAHGPAPPAPGRAPR